MNARRRKYIPLKEKLAAALLMLLPQDMRDQHRRLRVPATSIIGIFDFDHVILHAHGGEDKCWNLTPLMRGAHREKSRGDTTIVAKTKRISAAHEDFRRRVLAVEKKPRERKSRWPQGRKLQSRSNFERGA